MVPPQKPSFSSLTSRACDGRARGARWSLTLRPLAQASSPSPHHSGPAPREDSWGLRAGTRTRPAQPHAHPQGPCCPAPPVLGAGPLWTPQPCRGPSTTAEGLLPTQIQPLPVCISRLRKAPQQLYVQKNCCLLSLVGIRPQTRQTPGSGRDTYYAGPADASTIRTPSRSCGCYHSRPVPGIHVADLTGRGAGNTPPGWGADWASESTDPSPIFLLPKELGRQMPRERFLLSLLWGLALL